MLLKLCARCKKVIQAPNRYCKRCSELFDKEKEINKQKQMSRYNQKRNKQYKKFYNSKEWKILRNTYLEKNPICEMCKEEAKKNNKYTVQLTEEVHHKEPIQTPTGWLRRFEWNNLIGLCHKHHDEKHKRFKKKK